MSAKLLDAEEVVLLICAVLVSAAAAWVFATSKVHREAVELGHGYWSVDAGGKAEFHWHK
jgi:hypothetical protein